MSRWISYPSALSWWLLGPNDTTMMVTLMCAVLIYRHKSNITKLLAGTEARFGGPKWTRRLSRQ